MSIAEKLTTVAENQQKVYDAGYENGKAEQLEALWNGLLVNGTRNNYTYLFTTWTPDVFTPTRDIYPVNGSYMFNNFNINGSAINLTTHLANLGVKLDTSRCTNFKCMFYYARFNRIPEIDTRKATTINDIFHSCPMVKTIDKVILKDDGSQVLYTDSYAQCFYNCTSLENIDFEGVIGGSNIDFRQCTKLKAQSMVNVVEHLSTTADKKAVFFSETAVNNADWSTTNYASWEELIATRSNWSFSLMV